MAAQNVANSVGVLKNLFSPRRVQYLGYLNNPFMAMVPKFTGFEGDFFKMPVFYGGNQGGSRVFATAQSNKTGGLYNAFYLTRTKDYSLTSIELEAIQASASDAGSFLRLATSEVDNTVRMAGRNLAIGLYRNTGGARGQVGSVSTVTLTLKNVNDVVNFEVGMKITSSTTDGTSGSDDAEAIAITNIDRQLGTLTAAVTWTTNGHFANNSFLFRQGDFGLSVAGLDSWLPASAPSNTLFFGVDRSVDKTRLGGVRYDGSAEIIEEALMSAESILSREGGNPDAVFMAPSDFNDFRKSMTSKVEYDLVRSPDVAQVSFKAIVLKGSQGDIKVVQDRNCPQGVAYMLQLDTWTLATLGPAPKILENPTMDVKFIWDFNGDSIEIRSGYYGNLGCYAPGKNCRITLPS